VFPFKKRLPASAMEFGSPAQPMKAAFRSQEKARGKRQSSEARNSRGTQVSGMAFFVAF